MVAVTNGNITKKDNDPKKAKGNWCLLSQISSEFWNQCRRSKRAHSAIFFAETPSALAIAWRLRICCAFLLTQVGPLWIANFPYRVTKLDKIQNALIPRRRNEQCAPLAVADR